jgi:hypothetical protein
VPSHRRPRFYNENQLAAPQKPPDAFDLVAALANLRSTVEGACEHPEYVETIMRQVGTLLAGVPRVVSQAPAPCWCEGKHGIALLKGLCEAADAGKALDSYTTRSLVEKLDGRNRLAELLKE